VVDSENGPEGRCVARGRVQGLPGCEALVHWANLDTRWQASVLAWDCKPPASTDPVCLQHIIKFHYS